MSGKFRVSVVVSVAQLPDMLKAVYGTAHVGEPSLEVAGSVNGRAAPTTKKGGGKAGNPRRANSSTIGARLRSARMAAGHKQYEVAEMLGIDGALKYRQTLISRIERGAAVIGKELREQLNTYIEEAGK